MRIKTLLCAAGIAALAIPAMAQTPPVYSLNVVGYVNLTFQGGAYQMVANQLDKDGTGTNNTIFTVFGTSLPQGSVVYKWNNGWVQYSYGKAGWSPNSTASMNPGEGVLVKLGGTSLVTNTVVGTVLQGSLTNIYIPAGGGYCGLSSIVPITGQIQADLKYVPKTSDVVYKWNGGWVQYSYGKAGWSPPQPTINAGEGFLLKTSPGQTWTNNFVVGQ